MEIVDPLVPAVDPVAEVHKPRRRVFGNGLPALMAMAAAMPATLPGESRRPRINQLTPGADPQLAADRRRERFSENTPHQGTSEKARRRRQMERDAANAAKRAATANVPQTERA